MSPIFTIARRELLALFASPVGFVVVGLQALVGGMVFFLGFDSGSPATLRDTMSFLAWSLIFITPAISMRMVSEEFRSGTIESLMTAPVTDGQVVVGKWLGAWLFFGVAVLVTFASLGGVLLAYARPDPGPMVGQALGLMLVGALYLAAGLAASAVTASQVVAFLLTVFVIGLLTLGMSQLAAIPHFPPWLQRAFFHMKVDTHFEEFNKGVVDSGALIYFLSTTGLLLFIAVKLLESRRWR